MLPSEEPFEGDDIEPSSSKIPSESAEDHEEDEEDLDEEDVLVRISNIFDVRGFCHVNLKDARFNITHNESTG